MSELREVTRGLAFPEGPVAMPDGSVILVELFGPGLRRVHPDGSKETVATVAGSLNGAALAPDGRMIVCNNGGRFSEARVGDMIFPGPWDKSKYIGGRIQAIDLETGEVEDLYTESEGH